MAVGTEVGMAVAGVPWATPMMRLANPRSTASPRLPSVGEITHRSPA